MNNTIDLEQNILNFDSDELQMRKRIIGLSDEDESFIRSLQTIVSPHFEKIVDSFYGELTLHDELRKIIDRSSSVIRLKRTFVDYLAEVFTGSFDVDYSRKRLRVGLTHARVGLSLNWYLSFISRLQDLILEELKLYLKTKDTETAVLCTRAIARVMAFDQSLACYAYHIFIAGELSEKVKQANAGIKAKVNFLASMSHELRTPLNSILGFSELLLSQNMLPDAKAQNFVDIINRNGKNLLVIVDDILDLAKADSGTLRLHLEEQSIDALMVDIEHILASLIRTKPELKHHVNWDRGSKLRTDFGKLRQILLNFISNAVKFSERGAVSVSVERHLGEMVFSIRDSGCGISEADQKVIFGEFVQGSSPHRVKGVGLGLAICRTLSELLGGRITVESTLNEGSNFKLYLPYSEGIL